MAEELQSFLKVLSAAVSCSQCPVTSSKFDVVAELTKEIQARLSSCSEEWAQSIQETDECSPSTSRGANDPRVRLGHVLTKIYEQLSRCLRKLKAGGRDEYTFLSVQEQAQVTATLEFYVLAQLLPYLDEGVGIPINKRSQYVKTWSRIDQDLEFRKIQILQFLSTIHVLIESNETLKLAAVRSVLSDVISAEEQLIQFGENGQDWINKLLNEVPKRELIAILMSLSKCYNRLKPSPLWFTTAIGTRLSTVLRSSDGLYHFLGAYDEAGSGFWDNTHLLSKIAQQLALPPKSSKVMAYFEKIHKEFIAILKTKTYPERGMIQLYSSFADSMTAKQSLAGEVLVLDFLLKPFEILLDSSPDLISWSRAFTDAIWMLDLLSDDKIYPKVLANSSRLVQLIPFFLGLLTSDSFDYEAVPTEIKSLSTKILKILSFILPKVENASELLFSFIVSTDSNCYQLVYKKTLITVVGDQNDSNLSIQRVPNSDREAVLMLKLDAVLKYIKELEKSAGSCLIIEILYESAKMWTSNSEQREEPRFVTLGSTIVESDWLRMASHLVALFCFEHLGEWEVDPTNSYMLTALSKLITIILDKAVEWLQARKEDDSFFDVSANLPEEESRIVKVQQMSIQLAVGLAAAVVAAGTVESASVLSEIPASLTRFVAVASADKELSEIVKDAQEVLQLLNMLGLKTDVQVQAAQVASRARPSVDFLEQLRLDLDDEMVPIRGEALLRVSKALRRRDPKALSVLEPWLYARVKELVADPDSYVFLSAINTMAEIALYDPKKYLNELLQLFSDLRHEKEQTDASLILRGNIAEVIGKVFRLLGDISPVWLDRAANIFLNALRENSDIIRASSLSAFSDLVAACRGRGLEKILNELFYAVETIIRTEKSELVRRAAIHLIRQCLRSCDKDLLSILGDRLRDLRRELTRLWKWDKDHVVRLHAELCLEEIGDGLKSALEDGHRQHLRVISMK